ncbi:tetratricopeptide repeat protein [Anoxybacteroides amylolyticum]|uniref:Tetratricopeptide repeat family protein n=1 Tax=Anoxybacteroides amylolyticum TaxID=294699 RepID=A0A161HXF8_9BACL|nr:tetratricopeptide repeat protein [Anoxybacillus amylolyticus]ANB59287.1 tetratricopeptide repeat family protein [Anoxybacillus amylolyticus]
MNRIDQIVQLVERGDIERALPLISKAKKEANDDEKYMLADYLFSFGMLEEARAIVEELVQRYPDEGELFIFLAEIYTELEEDEKALAILTDIDEEDPLFLRACLLLADLYQIQGLEEVSEQKLLKAYEKAPNEPIIEFALAELYFATGQYGKSISFYKKVLERETTVAGTFIPERLAEALSLLGEFEQALPYYEQTIEKKMDSHTLFGYGFTAFQAEYYQTAIEKLTQLKELDRDYVPLYLYLAKAYEHEGDVTKSYEIAKEGLLVDEWNKELLFYAGKIALKLGNEEEAETYLQKAVDIDLGYVEALVALASVWMHQERYEDVVRCLQYAIDQGEYDPQLEWYLARAKHKLEMYSDALNHYQEAYTFFKNDVSFLEEYGYFLIEEGDRERAKAMFAQIVRLDPANTEAAQMLLQLEE